MSRVHFIGGEKGGVGKSVVARLLSQYFIDRAIPFLGFDTDRSHGSLIRFYADYASPVVIDQFEGLDGIIEAAVADPERRIIVDLAAQTQRFLSQWIDESGLLDADSDLDVPMTYWHVMDAGRDSAELLDKLLDEFAGRLSLMVVLNEVRGNDFAIVESTGALTRARDAGASVVSIRRLQDAAMQKIDAQNTSFWAATHRDGHGQSTLGLLERQRVKQWLKKVYEGLDSLSL
jgi:hypothetical protein